MAIVVEPRFRGPEQSGNGGYCSGLFALAHGGDVVEVTLRLPPPLETPLELVDGRIMAGEDVVAEVRDAELGVTAPDHVSFGDAAAAAHPDLSSPFPSCFVCGYARGPDALHIHAGPLADRPVFAAPWTVHDDTVGPEFVWAALDCPGAYATGVPGRGTVVLGQLTARVDRVPEAGEDCVVVARSLGSDGRKHGALTALFTASGELLGLARALWIEPRE
ncbi:MAG TPA: hypothetical protein VFK17_04780 [Gaiellaceae bacterium]|jgi:hypothetical protein|nr:hypothetical protein [Gaiellaceae bacterium]